MISDADLAQLRAIQEESMTETVVIRRVTVAADAHGAYTKTTAVVMTTKGRISFTGRTPQEQIIAQRVAPRQTHNIALPAGTDVREGDLLECTSTAGEVRTFEILGALKRTIESARRVIGLEKL